eukprot:4053416-Pleurochrysis_carterae.AAC.1
MRRTVAPPLSLVPMASSMWPRRLHRNVFLLAATQPATISAWQELAATLSRRELQSTGPLANMPRCAMYV